MRKESPDPLRDEDHVLTVLLQILDLVRYGGARFNGGYTALENVLRISRNSVNGKLIPYALLQTQNCTGKFETGSKSCALL